MRGNPASVPSASSGEVLEALRNATAALHQQLDRELPLAQQDAGLDAYADHLRHLRAWLLLDFPEARARVPERRADLLARIESDLAHPSVGGVNTGAVPARSASPSPYRDEAAYRWGVDYVVEGSQLGGSVLYRRLAGKLAPHPLNYLKGDGDGTDPLWRVFVDDLRRHVRSQRDIALASRGAVHAFTSLLISFELRPAVARAA
jgi:heme oxygenase